MFISQQVEVLIGVRFGYVVDIIVKSNVPKSEPEQMHTLFQSVVIDKLSEINVISQKSEAKYFPCDPVNVSMQDGDILASITVIFQNRKMMEKFFKEVNSLK